MGLFSEKCWKSLARMVLSLALFVPNHAAADTEAPLKLCWVGHSTAMIQLGDRWVLTDPMFSSRFLWVMRRKAPLGFELKDLPSPGLVLISHEHRDHMDFPSLRALDSEAEVAMPPGTKMRNLSFSKEHILEAWESSEAAGIHLTATPVQHWGGRFAIDGLWRHTFSGYVISYQGWTVLFVGDSGYNQSLFEEIGRRFDIDLALIPVGPAGGPSFFRWFTKAPHANPEEAMEILVDTGAQWMVPIHHSTFYTVGPKEKASIENARIAHPRAEDTLVLQHGECVDFGSTDGPIRNVPPPKVD
jgi:L-ascorbate metabolism protein UlaG (beta-lactamase superfamily)